MKLRPIIVLLLFVVSAGALAWIYYAATRTPLPPKTLPWIETIADLDDCCRRKHVKAVQYDHFARLAEQEQIDRPCLLFRALACSERLQEENCARVIVHLGGHYTAPERIVLFHSTTTGNMERSAAYERRMLEEFHCAAIGRALDRGNRYAARILIWAAAADMRHIALLEHCDTCRTTPQSGYMVCPRCGNIYELDYCDSYCPFCMTEGNKFIRFE